MKFPRPTESGSAPNNPAKLNPKADALLNELYRRVQMKSVLLFVWESLLTPAERVHLGNEITEARRTRGGTAGMFASVRGIPVGRAVVEIATAFNLIPLATALRLTGELRRVYGPASAESDDADMSEVVKQARTTKDLVLVEGAGTRSVYWIGDRVDVDFSKFPKCWEFLRLLAEQACKGERLDYSMLNLKKDKDLRSRKGNLKRSGFPKEILDLIKPDGPGAYRLDLHVDQVMVIDLGTDDWGLDPSDN